MNRTGLFLGLAATLSLLALIVGLPDRVADKQQPVVTPGNTTPPLAAATDGAIKMQGRLSHPYISAGTSDVFVTVDLTGADVPGAQRAPVNLALVIDRSGSMSGQKLQQAKQAARQLVNQLKDTDRLAIVHYGSDVRSFPSATATPQNRERMLSYIDNIFDEGGTNIADALSAGRDQLLSGLREYKVNRVILISDGQPTEGLTDPADLTNVVRQIRSNGVSVSSIGVGTDFNEDLMQAFAEIGAGSYGYLRDASQLATIFNKDLQNATAMVARNVELSFQLPEGVELGEVLGYHSNQSGRTVTVTLPDFSSGQLERVVARVVVSAGAVGKAIDVASLRLSYSDLLTDKDVHSDAKLAAMVTDKAEEVAQHQDRDATVLATRAQTARNTWEAGESFKRGDRARAKQLLQQNQAMFQAAAQVAGPEAVKADVAEQNSMMSGMDSAQSDEEVQHQAKAAKRRAMIDYGRVTSTY